MRQNRPYRPLHMLNEKKKRAPDLSMRQNRPNRPFRPSEHFASWPLIDSRVLGWPELPSRRNSGIYGGCRERVPHDLLFPTDPFIHQAPGGLINMNLPQELQTDRLHLRHWLSNDRLPFARLNCDPRVVEFLPGALSRKESDALADRIEAHFERHGFGLWAVAIPGVTPFAGFIGLSIPRFEAPFTPCIEIGWRLDPEHWNRGYATEGARAALAFGFRWLRADEILSFTVPANVRSRRVMEKIGMTHSANDDFDHPLLAEGHPLRQHVLYRLRRPEFA